MPCTPGPGGVDEEHRNTFLIGVLYMCQPGLRKSWLAVKAPPPISPPTKLLFHASISSGFHDFLVKNAIAKAWRESLDLALDDRQQISGDPFGTRQYAQAVCLPCGARVLSNRLG